MNAGPDPPWDLLPGDPEQFFGLDGDYDRRTLKRAYNALIRRFKPERFPDKFQKIRAAFELLDGRLRYGPQRSLPPQPTTAWDAGQRPPATAPMPRSKRPAMDVVLSALQQHPPQEVYEALRRKGRRDPFEYFALAALADVVEDDTTTYYHWILEGLQAYPMESGLIELLRAACTDPPATARIPNLLVAVSKVLRGDAFFYVTEPLWDHLLRDAPFDTFRDCLQVCEERFTEMDGIHGRTVFYLHVLRAAIWIADPEWIERTVDFLEAHHDIIPDVLEFDFEIALALRDYGRDTAAFLNGDPVRQAMHEALRAYCTLDTVAGDHALIACQQALIADPQPLLDAFPVTDPTSGSFTQCWLWIVEEVAERLELIDDPPPFKRVVRDTFQFMRELDAEEGNVAWSVMVIGHALSNGVAYGAFLGLPWLINSTLLGSQARWEGVAVCGVLSAVCYHFFIRPRTLAPLLEQWLIRVVRRRYRQRWRLATLRFLDSTPAAFDMFLHIVERLVRTRNEALSSSTWLVHLLPADRALAVYTAAVRLMP